eukprot:Opistho-2@37784
MQSNGLAKMDDSGRGRGAVGCKQLSRDGQLYRSATKQHKIGMNKAHAQNYPQQCGTQHAVAIIIFINNTTKQSTSIACQRGNAHHALQHNTTKSKTKKLKAVQCISANIKASANSAASATNIAHSNSHKKQKEQNDVPTSYFHRDLAWDTEFST